MLPTRISVSSARGTYDVIVGAGSLAHLPEYLAERGLAHSTAAVVSCPPVWRRVGPSMKNLGAARRPLLMPDGERAKSLATVARIYDGLIERRLDRASMLVAVGGGVVGDVAGFAAATYLRGITLVQVPTTVLAQVDSAIGGKVGVNLPAGKNLVGAFHPPALVVVDPQVLRSLPPREFRAGFYEVVKYGVIASASLLDRVAREWTAALEHRSDVLTPIVAECCAIKAAVVSADERESGPRRTLNFGHTIGHALEGLTNYRRFRHGEAVAYGMLAAARLSVMRGTLSVEDEQRLAAVIRTIGPLPKVSDLSAARALLLIGRDKKVVSGRLHFVLASGIGATSIVDDVSARELKAAMVSVGMRAT